MGYIIFRTVDSREHHFNELERELKKQFAIYKNKKLEIDDCSSFDEYYENKRINKNLYIDYHDTFELDVEDYSYDLILIYLTKKDLSPISYYVTISVEKCLSNHTTLLSLRFDDLCEAQEMYLKYKKILQEKNDVLLLRKIEKDFKKNEWDLY